MFLSVVIACYNVEKTVKRTLDSIVNQDDLDLEVIAVDDGSIDNTLNILNEYACKYQFIKIISQDNRGVCQALSNGITKCSGKYIYCLDADDKITKNFVSYLKKYNGGFDIIEFSFNVVDENGKLLNVVKNRKFEFSNKNEVNKFLNVLYLDHNCFDSFRYISIYKWSKIIKSEIVKEIVSNYKKLNFKLYEDLVYVMLAASKSKKIKSVDFVGIYYYQIPNSHSRKNMDLNYNDLLELRNKLRLFLNEYAKTNNLDKNSFKTMDFNVSKFYFTRLIKKYHIKVLKKFFDKMKKDKVYQDEKKYVSLDGVSFKRKVYFYLMKYDMFYLIYFCFKYLM